jgi:hypothetical protein
MKQTAVEWLINEINMQYPKINVRWKAWIIDQAKEMEKKQLIDAYQTSHISMMTAEQYYNKTFKNTDK